MSGIIADVLARESFFIRDLCKLIDSYVCISDDDRIKYMLANRDEPNVLICDLCVSHDFDEILDISFGREVESWKSDSILSRVESLENRTYKVYLKLSECNGITTEYTLFALLRDMRECKSWYFTSKSSFRWRDVFNINCSDYGRLGAKLYSLWQPKDTGLAFEDRKLKYLTDDYFANMCIFLSVRFQLTD